MPDKKLEYYSAEVLIVDDTLANLQLLASILQEEGYKVRPATSGEMALQAIAKRKPDLILLDIKMPNMDGYEICEKLKANHETRSIPIIFISALNDIVDKVKAFNIGAVDYINKPFQFEEVKARVSTHLKLKSYQTEMEQKVSEGIAKISNLNHEIINTQRELIYIMGELCETRSMETGQHVKRVSEYSYLLATLCNYENPELMREATPMHDVGKMGISDAILHKTGKLTAEEWQIMKTHTIQGFTMLSISTRPLLKTAAKIAHEHHEKWDGNGYPQGIAGEAISIEARITTIADVFDALGSARCYKEAWELPEILDYMKKNREVQFDPTLLDLFFEHLEAFLVIRDTFKG